MVIDCGFIHHYSHKHVGSRLRNFQHLIRNFRDTNINIISFSFVFMSIRLHIQYRADKTSGWRDADKGWLSLIII